MCKHIAAVLMLRFSVEEFRNYHGAIMISCVGQGIGHGTWVICHRVFDRLDLGGTL